MMWLEYLRVAVKALKAHKGRSALTVFSITIGAFSIVLMSSMAESGLRTLFKSIEEMGGARMIMILPNIPERAESKTSSYARGVTREDRELLFDKLPHLVDHGAWVSRRRMEVTADSGNIVRTSLAAGDGNFFSTFGMRVTAGRPFTDADNREHGRVCLVGPKLADALWDGTPVGRSLKVGMLGCRVIGLLAEQDRWFIGFGFDWVDVVVMPLETFFDFYPQQPPQGVPMLFKTDDVRSNDIVKRIANAILSERHHQVDDYKIGDFKGVMERFNAIFGIMKAIVGFVAGIALLVGGVGIMNMMLVSVSERVREIGIRKAIGANPRDIGAQFLFEAMVLSGFGGLVGVLSGVAMALTSGWLIRHFKPSWITVISDRAVLMALGVSVAVGLVFGFFPARRASRQDPISAIRQ